jgi:hypothetical protein
LLFLQLQPSGCHQQPPDLLLLLPLLLAPHQLPHQQQQGETVTLANLLLLWVT